MQIRFSVNQRITVLTNKYEIFSGPDATQLIAFAEQAKMKIKEKISFFQDESKSQLLFTLQAEKVLDIHGKYLVNDASGNLLGQFRKDFASSLFSSTWFVEDSEGNQLFKFTEDNAGLAILRRVGDFIPFVGDFIRMIPYHFAIVDLATGAVVGRYEKTALIRDRYNLLLSDTGWEKADSRVLMGLAIGLDALQSR